MLLQAEAPQEKHRYSKAASLILLVVGALGCASCYVMRGSSSSTALHRHLLSLPAAEPHHICVTGSRAHEMMESYVLPNGHKLAEYKMESSLDPENECTVHDYAVGHTLFLVADNIKDRCAARWKAHSSTCDVLVHAHAGSDCNEMFKLRMVTDQCEAPLLVYQADEALLKCYGAKVQQAIMQGTMPLGIECTQAHQADDIESAIQKALAKTSPAARKKFRHIPLVKDQGAFGIAAKLRHHLHHGKARSLDLTLEFLKKTQGLVADNQALALLQRLDAKGRRLDGGDGTDAPDQKSIVVDNGSGTVKAGFAGEDAPSAIFPSIVGKERHKGVMVGMGQKDIYVGDEANSKRGVLKIEYPIVHGIVQNWEDMELIWRHTFSNSLRIDPREVLGILLTEPPLNPLANREKMGKMMFDEFQFKGVYISTQAVLALYAAGQTTGLILDSGDGVTHTVPIYEGYALPHAVQRMDTAGHDLTDQMAVQLLKSNGHVKLQNSAEMEICKDLKEKLGYVALDIDAAEKAAEEGVVAEADANGMVAEEDGKYPLVKPFTLPDGQVMQVGAERFRVPEIIFQPKLMSLDQPGVVDLAFDSMMTTDVDIRKFLAASIYLTGGTTMFKNFPERVEKDFNALWIKKGSTLRCSIKDEATRKYSVWLGGSILASLNSFQQFWIKQSEYVESGDSVFIPPQ